MNIIIFVDGQNLYRSAKDAWRIEGTKDTYHYTWPSYDVEKLSIALTSQHSECELCQIRFYTGVPSEEQDFRWYHFWINKLELLRGQGIEVYRGRINTHKQEKGVDVKIAIDLIRLTYEKKYEAAIIISQDRDLEPAVQLAKRIARDQSRQLIFESHFPFGPGSDSDRGIPGTEWKLIDKDTYDACRDYRDYRNPITI
jgi:uncharacterized LabA/DUF88 family protein